MRRVRDVAAASAAHAAAEVAQRRSTIAAELLRAEDPQQILKLLSAHKTDVSRTDCEAVWLKIARSKILQAAHELATVREDLTFVEARMRGLPRTSGLWPETDEKRVDVWLVPDAARDWIRDAQGEREQLVDLWLDAEGQTWRVFGPNDVYRAGQKIIRKDQFRGARRRTWTDDGRKTSRRLATDEESPWLTS